MINMLLTIRRFLLNNSVDECLQIPVSLRLKLIYFLKLYKSICVNELCEVHESTSYSDHELHVHDLGIDLSCSEKIETSAKSSDWYANLHGVNVFGEELIDLVSLMGFVEHVWNGLSSSGIIIQLWCFLSQRLFESLNNDLLVSEHILQGLKLINLLLENLGELFTLLLKLLDLLFESLVSSLSLLKSVLKLMHNSSLLLNFKNIDINLMLKLYYLLLILDDLRVSVDHEKSSGVHFLESGDLVV